MDIYGLTIEDVEFIDAGFVCSLDREIQTLQILSPTIHLIGFLNMEKRCFNALCLEYRLISEGFNQENAVKNIAPLVVEYLQEEGNSERKNSAILHQGKEIWSMFHQYKKQIEDDFFESQKGIIKEQGSSMEKTITALEETLYKRREPTKSYVNIMNTLFMGNNEVPMQEEEEEEEEEKEEEQEQILFINTQLFCQYRGERQVQMGT